MKSVLEELYYGNIRPFANHRNTSEETKMMIQSIEVYRKQFFSSLTENQRQLWEQYENAFSEITSRSECEIFIDGFLLGVRFSNEIYK